MDEIKIGFDFSGQNQDKLIEEIIKLHEEIDSLSKSMINLPMDQVNQKLSELRIGFQGFQQLAIKLNQSVPEQAKALSDLISPLQENIDKISSLSKANQAASKTLSDFQRELKAAESNLNSIVKSIEQYRIGTYKGKESIDSLNASLVQAKTRYTELNETIKIQLTEIEKEIGYYENLKTIVKELIAERDLLIVSEGKESQSVETLTKLINKYNLELQINNRELNGLNTATSLLQKNEEALQKIRNQDLESLIELGVAQKSFNDARKEGIYISSGARSKEEEETIQKMLLENNKYVQKLDENEKIIEEKSIKLSLKRIEEEDKTIRTMLLENDKYVQKLDENEKKILINTIKSEERKFEEKEKIRQTQLKLIEDQEKREVASIQRLVEKTETAEKRKQESSEKTSLIYKLQQFVVRDLIRLTAAMLTIYPIMYFIGALEDLIKWLLNTSEEVENVKKITEKYGLELKNVGTEIDNVIEKEKILNEVLLETAKNSQISFDKRTESINKYRDAYGHLLDSYTDEQIASQETDIIVKTGKADRLRILQEESKQRLDIRNKELDELTKKRIELVSKFETTPFYHPIDKMNLTAAIKEVTTRRNLLQLGKDPDTKKDIGLKSDLEKDFESKTQSYQEFINNKSDIGLIPLLQGEIAQLEETLKRRSYEKYGITDKTTASDIRKMKKNIDTDPEFLKPISDIQQKKDELSELMGKRDPKGSHKKDKTLEESLGLESSEHESNLLTIKSSYDQSNRSFQDRKEMYQLQENEATRHKDKMLKIIEEYKDLSEESEIKLKKRRKDAENEQSKEFNHIQEERNKDLLDLKKYNDEQIKIIDEINLKLSKRAEQNKREVDKISLKTEEGRIDKSKAKRFNIFSSILGGDGSTPAQDFKDKQKKFDLEIDNIKSDVKDDSIKSDITGANEFGLKEKVKSDLSIPKLLRSPEQDEDLKLHQSELNKQIEETSAIQSKQSQDQLKLVEETNKKEVSLEEEKKDAKIRVSNETFQSVQKITNAAFDAQKKRIEMAIQNTQAQYALEMQLAGNNSAGKLRIARQEHDQILSLKRKEAQADKQQGVYNTLISMATGIAKAWENPISAPYVTALIVAADLAQISAILSAPLPAYKFGRSGGKKELARVGEEGFEIGEKNGKVRILGNGIAELEEGEKVHTHRESEIFLKTLLKGTGVISQRDRLDKEQRFHAIQVGISKQDFQDVMDNAVRKIPQPNQVILPAPGIISRHQAQQRRNGVTD